MKKNSIQILLIILAIGLAIVSWFFLPDVVAVQVGLDGQVTNTMPKIFAIMIPFVISIVGSVTMTKENKKGMILSIAGILILIVSLIFNI
ncbi:DUF1648 domain-containing protein [Floccifex sp.]|uniref:DUF1648 domain-containing protein n=1 Tax=Floccifex sp. TaxID=2815810 RepID=UPI003EFE532F